MKILLIISLLLQLAAFSGPVCGNHATTGESMDCCQKGHNDSAAGIHDPHSAACCATCDMGKTAGLKQNNVTSVEVKHMPFLFQLPALHVSEVSAFFCEAKHEYPPGAFPISLEQPLRI